MWNQIDKVDSVSLFVCSRQLVSQPEYYYQHCKLWGMRGMFVVGHHRLTTIWLFTEGWSHGHSCLYTGLLCIFGSSSVWVCWYAIWTFNQKLQEVKCSCMLLVQMLPVRFDTSMLTVILRYGIWLVVFALRIYPISSWWYGIKCEYDIVPWLCQ